MYPLDQLDTLLAKDTDPSLGVLGTFPKLLPCIRHCVLQERCCLRLDLRREHFSALKHLDQARDTFIDECKDLLDRYHLHVDKLVYGIRCSELFSADSDRFEDFDLEDILPQLEEWSKLFRPLFFVESQLFSTHCLQALKACDDLSRVESLD